MRRFFSFRSSSSRSENSNPTASATKAPEDGGYWEPPWESNSKKPFIAKDNSRSQAAKNSVLSPEEDLSNRKLRRSLSFSSATGYSASRQGRSNHDRCKSPSPLGDSPHHVSECSPHYRSLTPERYTRTKTENQASVRQSDADDMLGSTSSSTGYQGSSVNSPCSSPIPLRCRPTRVTKISCRNKTLDLYIDGEARDKDSQKHSSDSRKDVCLADNRVLGTGKPPRAQSTAPSSPTYSKASARSYSFREVKDIPHRFSRQDWSRDDLWTSSPKKHTRKNWEKLPNAFPEKSMLKSGDSDSETIIKTECRYEEPMLNPPYDNIHCYSTEEPFVQKMNFSHEKGPTSMNVQDHITDEELDEKKKELEQMFVALSQEDLQLEELENSCLNESTLLQTIRNNSEDRRYLVFELYSQINCRITERNSAKERLKQAKLEIDTQTRRLEKEKNELQSSLEKELDRRSNIWSLKLEKFQSEEQRLRERVRELAEQNVSLQREISLLKGKEVDSRSRILNSETQLNDLTASLKEARTGNEGLHQALSELQDRFKAAEEEREFLEIGGKEREKENKELQKLVVQLQRVCSEQDRTINGLRQGYSDEIGKQSTERGENLTRLQMEQLRLTGVEQMLRKEVESRRSEIESLRHENMYLLDRFQGSGNGHSFSSVKLDMELRARVDCLQAQGLSLLGDNVIFSGDLLNFMKCKMYASGQEVNEYFDGYPVSEYTVKYQDLSRRVGNFKKCLQMIVSIVHEKSNLGVLECRSDVSRQLKGHTSEGVELELKAETLLTGVLREKLCSKELELEQLHADLASATRAHDVLQSETQRLQDDLSCLTHKTNDMELQMLKKNECINQLQHELKESKKEVTATRNILTMVSEERENMREQLKHSKERIMLLNHEVQSFKQSIDELKEDALIKEGQISILRDSMVDKPFDIICSPKSVKEFDMDY